MNTNDILLNKMHRVTLVLVLGTALLISTGALAAGGTLDPTFGTNGIVITDLGGPSDTAVNIALQSNGRIVVAGSAELDNNFPGYRTPVIVRYDPDGMLDKTFGTDGKVTAVIRGLARIALQTDGKLVLGGSMNGGLALARYTSTGALDSSFGTNGVAIAGQDGNFSLLFGDLAIQADGKIVVVGTQETGGHTYPSVIARFNENGTLDKDFRIKVFDDTNFPDSLQHYLRAVALQPDGKIIMAGDMLGKEGDNYITLGRLTTGQDPWLDPSFGTNGRGTVVTPLAGFIQSRGAIAIQPDGKIVIAGTMTDSYNPLNENLVLARYNSNGTLDTTLGGNGIVITDLGQNETGNDLALQTDGKILVAGKSYSGNASDVLLVRYNSDGTLDTTFGNGGKVISDLGGSDSAAGIVLQPDGKLLAAGAKDGDAVLARYNVSAVPSSTKTVVFKSKGTQDGWILESAEFSNAGGILNKTATTFNVGDDQRDRQYRSVISFNTASLPDNAIITSAQVNIKRQGLVGTDPFLTHGKLLLEIRNGLFNNNFELNLSHFAADPSSVTPDTFVGLSYTWYTAKVGYSNLAFVNKYGVTQFRLRFLLDDNDDLSADYMKVFTGDAQNSFQPQLIVTYTLP
jgi:uncharacterized delta-60 repeat protein